MNALFSVLATIYLLISPIAQAQLPLTIKCQQALQNSQPIQTTQRVLYTPKVQLHVSNFLLRQLQGDTITLKQMMDVLNSTLHFSVTGEPTIDLAVLPQLRHILEQTHQDILANRIQHSQSRTERRVQDLINLVSEIKPHHSIQLLPRNKKILDVGAGDGQIISRFAEQLKLNPKNIYALELAKYPNSATDINWVIYNQKGEIPLPDNSIDLVTLIMVLHHAPDPLKLLSEIYRVLRVNGEMIVRETDVSDLPLRDLSASEIFALNQILDNILYVVLDPNSGVPMMNNYQSRQYWIDLFEQVGFEVKVLGTFDPRSVFKPLHYHLRKLR